MTRRRGMEEPNSRDRWMVSYADFITLLFAFFVVLFASVHQSGSSVPKLSQAIHRGFLHPASMVRNGAVTLSAHSAADVGIAVDQHEPAVRQTLPETHPQNPVGTEPSRIEQMRLRLGEALGAELKNGEVTIGATPEGLVISLKEIGFFPSGSANLQPGACLKIERIAKVLSPSGFPLRVEGHSDDRPIYTAKFHSNWELSTARAMQVLMILVRDSHLDPRRLSVAGYGPYRPIASNATAAGRRLNRRVDLVVITRKVSPQPQP
ncbi:MAG: OmpA family protein [Acidobacteriaceae bacterium]